MIFYGSLILAKRFIEKKNTKTVRNLASENDGFMTGRLLAAMPFMNDARFSQAVIYICGHDDQGAIGLMINKTFPSLTFRELLRQLNIPISTMCRDLTMHYGGPVEISRGFVLHSCDFQVESTVVVDTSFAITSTLEILKVIAQGDGPKHIVATLGYSGWGPGQLEQEIQENTWMVVDATPELVFHSAMDEKWRLCMAQIGVDPAVLSLDCGRA